MSKKRVRFQMDNEQEKVYEEQERYDDDDVDKILEVRKIRKVGEAEIKGFCDICEKLKSVSQDPEQPQFYICIDCKINELSFCTDFLSIE